MDINVIEQVLSEAVERGALNADQVDEVIVQMRGADTDFAEAQAATQDRDRKVVDRDRKVVEALHRFNQATSSAVRLLNMAANN